ncbi:NAD-dependent epimerase/dehydratase family protein [Verrucomicrobia bacterium]|nr:NAD-dependent epimerase/dehydratase family protein [Verrucomicrobiota bacterium]
MTVKKYVVTGGAGFIGSNLTDKLIEEGHEVVVIDNISTGKKENVNPKASLVIADLCGAHKRGSYETKVKEACEGASAVFHMSALARVQPSIQDPFLYHKNNVNATLNLLQIAREANVGRVVYSASSSAYGQTDVLPTTETTPTDPISPYALQKLIGEQYCRVYSHCYDLETVSLRYFNIFGERQPFDGAYCTVMGIFARQRVNGEPLTIVGDGEQRRDFTYVGDVVSANIKAAHSTKVGKGEVINIGAGKNSSVNDLAALMGGPTTHLPAVLEPQESLADNSLAKELLDWEPTTTIYDWVPSYKKQLGI